MLSRDSALVFKDNVVAAERPAVIIRVEVVAERENTPGERVVNPGSKHFKLA